MSGVDKGIRAQVSDEPHPLPRCQRLPPKPPKHRRQTLSKLIAPEFTLTKSNFPFFPRVGSGDDRSESPLREYRQSKFNKFQQKFSMSSGRCDRSDAHVQPRWARNGGQHYSNGSHSSQTATQTVRKKTLKSGVHQTFSVFCLWFF